MKPKNLGKRVQEELAERTALSYTVNAKFEGEVASQLEHLAKLMGRSKTEALRWLAEATVGDAIEYYEAAGEPVSAPSEVDSFDERVISGSADGIKDLNSGDEFESKDVFGGNWGDFIDTDKQRCGIRFSKLVEAGVIQGVFFSRRRSDRHNIYEKR